MLPWPIFSDPTAPSPIGPSAAPRLRPSPAEALAELLAGNQRVMAGAARYGHQRNSAARGDREPRALVVGCLDARVPVEAVFDQEFGAICVVRSGGHVLDRAVIGSVEFAALDLAVPLVVVLGHQGCRAVTATVEAVRTGRRPIDGRRYLVEEITRAVRDVAPGDNALAGTTRAHILRTVATLRATPSLMEAIRAHRLDIVGALYDPDTDRVETL